MKTTLQSLFGLNGKTIVITGGGGILCGTMAKALGDLGAKVAILDLKPESADAVAKQITDVGGSAIGVPCNVLEPSSIQEAAKIVESKFGPIEILINGAGGNSKTATTGGTTVADLIDPTFFDLDPAGIQFVFNLNFLGTLLPTQVFARDMVKRKSGVILNITSMNAFCPLTKIPAYSAAKAAVGNFTQWMAVHFAPANIRVNAIAPGFFLTEQNRFLLTTNDGGMTPRGETIISQTPMKRYGTADELIAGMVYLLSDGAGFVTGTTLAIDGGFSAFSGV